MRGSPNGNSETVDRRIPDGGAAPHSLADDEGTAIWSFGALMNIKVSGADTGGAFALVDHLADPGVESPYHRHHNEEELFYVLDGEVTCYYGDDGEASVRAGPGETVYLPRNVPHGFRIGGDDPCRMLVLVAPAGVEELWMEAGEPALELTTPPPPEEPPDLDGMAPLFEEYGLDVFGPIPK